MLHLCIIFTPYSPLHIIVSEMAVLFACKPEQDLADKLHRLDSLEVKLIEIEFVVEDRWIPLEQALMEAVLLGSYV